MKFKDYIVESKQELDVESAAEIYLNKCDDTGIDDFYVRGVKNKTHPIYIADRTNTMDRKSIKFSNHLLKLTDHALKKAGYPLRSKSTIFTTKSMVGHARKFGELYYIFPYNGSKIASCERHDFNLIDLKYFDFDKISEFHQMLHISEISDDSFDSIANSIHKFVSGVTDTDSLNNDQLKLYELFNESNLDEIKESLETAFSPKWLKIELNDTKDDIGSKKREMWTDGNCLMIRRDAYPDFKTAVENISKKTS